MIKRKKFLTLLICYALIASSFITIESSTTAINVYAENDENKLKHFVLDYIGVMQMTEDEYKVEKNLTRAEFADYLAHGLKIDKAENSNHFKDIGADHWASLSVNGLAERGVIKGTGDSLFNPDEYITYVEACKMVISAIGFSEYAEAVGGFPYGYLSTVKALDIDIYINDSKYLSMEEGVSLLFNAFAAGVADYSKISVKDGKYNKKLEKSNKSIFSMYYDLYIEEGIVTSYFTGAMEGCREANENEVGISDEIFYLEKSINAKDFFTYNVDYVYIKSGDKQGTIVYIEKRKTKNDIKISHDDIIGFDEDSYYIEYEKLDKILKKRIDKSAKILLNGRIETTMSLQTIINSFVNKEARGTITLRSLNNNDNFDCILIYSYKTMAVLQTNEDKSILYNYNKTGEFIDVSDYNNVIIKDINNVTIDLDNNIPFVASVAVSTDKESAEIIVSKNIETIVPKVLYEKTCSIDTDDGTIKCDKAFFELYKDKIKLGKGINVICDVFGYITCLIDKNDDTPVSGYITAIALDSSSIDQDVLIKMYTENGEMEIYYVADKIKIDGITYRYDDKVKILNCLASTPIKSIENFSKYKADRQLVLYTLNSEGKINYIDTAKCNEEYENKNSTLNKLEKYSEYYYYTGSNRFGMRLWIKPGTTKTYMVPNYNSLGKVLDPLGNATDDDEKLYSTNVTFKGWSSYIIDAYYYGTSKLFADAVVVKNNAVKMDSTPYCFKERYDGINSDGESVTMVKALYGDKELDIEWENEEEINDLKTGDLFLIHNDLRGGVYKATKIYDAESRCFSGFDYVDDVVSIDDKRTLRDETGSSLLNVDISLTKGKVKDKDGYYISTQYENAAYGEEYSRIDNIEWKPIYVYDPSARNKKDRLRKGTVNDIISEKQNGVGTFIVFSNYRSSINFVLVYAQ